MRLLAALMTVLLLAGCGDSSATGDDPEPAADPAADTAFATELMHRDAALLNLLDVGLGRPLPRQVVMTTDQLRLDATDRMETAADLLESWGEEVPVTARDHGADHSSDNDVPVLDGAPTGEDLQALGNLPRKAFEEDFVALLTESLESTLGLAEDHEAADADLGALVQAAAMSCQQALDAL